MDTECQATAGPVTLPATAVPGLVSVVMPCYNSADFLAEAVDSVLRQRHGAVELLIIDDGSRDDSPRLMRTLEKAHPASIRCLCQPNRGPYQARNLALAEAKGEFIAFLDADDYWDADFLEKLVTRIRTSDLDLAYCGWQNVGVEGGFADPYIPPAYEQGDAVALALNACPWPIHAAVVRRELMARLGGFSERRFTSMDYDLWLRAIALEPRIGRVADVLAFYRWHDKGQISKVKARQVNDAWQVRRDFVNANPALISHIPPSELFEKVDGFLLRNARRAYWDRDLTSARELFRLALQGRAYRAADLRHILPSLLPERVYSALVAAADRRHTPS